MLGRFEEQPVAIKRMLKEYVHVALREVELLRNSDRHPNVIRSVFVSNDVTVPDVRLCYLAACLGGYLFACVLALTARFAAATIAWKKTLSLCTLPLSFALQPWLR